jgi:hypothetical protein
MDLGPYYRTLAASDRLHILVEELRWRGPTREILWELTTLAEDLEIAEGCSILASGSPRHECAPRQPR